MAAFLQNRRLWNKPSFITVFKGQSGMEWRYGIVDNLNLKWNKVLDQPLTITAGRQDILIGDFYDWWLVADGTPGDGSWTFYLDSVRLAWEPEPLKTRFDVIYIQQNSRPDEGIPTIGDSSDYTQTEQQERGVIVYGSNKSLKNMQLDGYFMYKHDDRETFVIQGTKKIPGDNADIYTFGGKITGTPADHWQYSLEGAYQFGQKEDIILGKDDTEASTLLAGRRSCLISSRIDLIINSVLWESFCRETTRKQIRTRCSICFGVAGRDGASCTSTPILWRREGALPS